MNFMEMPPKNDKVYEDLGKEHLEENVIKKDLSEERERAYEEFEKKFGMPGIVYKECRKKTTSDGRPFTLNRLSGKIDGLDINVIYEKNQHGKIGYMQGDLGDINIQSVLISLTGIKNSGWQDMNEKFESIVSGYEKEAIPAQEEERKIEKAKKLKEAQAIMNKLEGGLKHFEKQQAEKE